MHLEYCVHSQSQAAQAQYVTVETKETLTNNIGFGHWTCICKPLTHLKWI